MKTGHRTETGQDKEVKDDMMKEAESGQANILTTGETKSRCLVAQISFFSLRYYLQGSCQL
jgi:hypothetical protein